MMRLGEVLRRAERFESRDDFIEYPFAGTYSFARGIFVGERKLGSSFSLPRIQRIRSGDFVYCKIMAWEGAFGLVPPEADGCVMSSAFVVYEINHTQVEPKFLDYYFKIPANWKTIGAQSTGTNVRRQSLHPDQFENSSIPIPSLPEQRRIVARIEEVADKINEARELRQQVVEQAEALMAAYLNRLFGDYYKKSAGQLKLTNWTRLGDVVTDVADGPHITPTYVAEGIPFITVLNITSGRIHFGDHKYVTPDDHSQFQKRAKAEMGDVLISKDGTIGIPCFVDTDRPFSVFVSVALIKPKRNELDGKFLVWVIRTPYLQERIKSRSRGDMIRHLVLREIRDLMIPLPSLPEQRRIVAELEPLQAKAGRLRKLQAETTAELDALLPSILDNAFNGKL